MATRLKLFDVPRNTKITLREGDCELELMFHHIDGMYSYCTNDKGTVIHLAAWTEVEIDERSDCLEIVDTSGKEMPR